MVQRLSGKGIWAGLGLAGCLVFLWAVVRIGGPAATNLGYIRLTKALESDPAGRDSSAISSFADAKIWLASAGRDDEDAQGYLIANAGAAAVLPDLSQIARLEGTPRGQVSLTVIVELMYSRMLALEESGHPEQASALWQDLERMQINLPASAVLGRKDHVDKLVPYRRGLQSAIQQYEIVVLLRRPTPSDLITLVALNQKAGDRAGVERWQAEIRARFHDEYLQDLYSNPFGLDALAYAYSQYGLYDDAISLEGQALALSPNFPWGNREMAAFQIKSGMYEQAESHLQTAIAHAESDTNKIQWYLSDLGDLYAVWGKPVLAGEVYCQMLSEGTRLGVKPDRPGIKPVITRIADLAHIQESSVAGYCSAMSSNG